MRQPHHRGGISQMDGRRDAGQAIRHPHSLCEAAVATSNSPPCGNSPYGCSEMLSGPNPSTQKRKLQPWSRQVRDGDQPHRPYCLAVTAQEVSEYVCHRIPGVLHRLWQFAGRSIWQGKCHFAVRCLRCFKSRYVFFSPPLAIIPHLGLSLYGRKNPSGFYR